MNQGENIMLKVKEIINEKVDEMYEYYKFLGLKKSEFKTIVGVFDESISNYSNSELEKAIENQIKRSMNNFINNNLNSFKNIKLVLKFIDQHLIDSNLNSLTSFLNDVGYILSIDDCIELLNKNKTLYDILNKIISDNIKLIETDNINLISSDINIINLTNTYCTLNNIEACDNSIETISITEKYEMNALDYYFNDLKREKILSQEQIEDLYKRIKKGDISARNKLIEGNLRLVIKIVKKYSNFGIPLEDLIQEGNIELINVCNRYNIDKGCFSKYAWACIDLKIRSYIGNKINFIKLPPKFGDKINKLKRERRKFIETYGYNPTVEQLSNLLNLPTAEIYDLINHEYEMVSLNQPINEAGDTLEKTIPDSINLDEFVDEKEMKAQLYELLNTLSETEQEILKKRFGIGEYQGQTLEEIAKELKISKEAVRQKQLIALHKLKKSLKTEKLCVYACDPTKTHKYLQEYRNNPENKGKIPPQLKKLKK